MKKQKKGGLLGKLVQKKVKLVKKILGVRHLPVHCPTTASCGIQSKVLRRLQAPLADNVIRTTALLAC